MENDRSAPEALETQLDLALRLPPRQRLDALLHAPKPMALVRSLPDAEVHLLVREVGPEDALPLLALASPSQTQHLIDMESWRGDRFDAERSGAWIATLLEAGEAALRRFARHADDETLKILFRDWARARPILIDDQEPVQGHGETEAGTEIGFVSPDGAYRFNPEHPEHVAAVRRLAEILFADDATRYARLLWDARHDLPSELEEEALRWRQSRLEENGFPSPDEAATIYAEPSTAAPPLAPLVVDGGAPVPALRSPWTASPGREFLARALDRLSGPDREGALASLGALATRVLIADGADTGDLDAIRHAFDRAASYVVVALEVRGASDPADAAQVLAAVPAPQLFREGYREASRLQDRASRLVSRGWCGGSRRALSLLDAPMRPTVEALLRPRPLRWVPPTGEAGATARDFSRLEEIREARAVVDASERIGRVLAGVLGLDPAAWAEAPFASEERPVTWSTLLLTALAHHALRGERSIAPLAEGDARAFTAGVASPEALERWITEVAAPSTAEEDLPILRAFGRASLDRLAAEEPRRPGTCLRVTRDD